MCVLLFFAKTVQDWKEVTVDVMLLALYKLQLFYLQEIPRSLNNLGPYTPHDPVSESVHSGQYTCGTAYIQFSNCNLNYKTIT